MSKELITDKEAICIFIIFIIGSTAILGSGGDAKNAAWLAGIIAISAALPMTLVYGRLLTLFPGKGLYEIFELITGSYISKALSIIYIWYSFHLGALVMRNFGEFVNTVAMPETPIMFPMLCLALVSIISVKSGIEIIGRLSAHILPFIIFIIIIIQLLSVPLLNFSNLKPFGEEGITAILSGAFSAFSFPYAETVLFIVILFSLKNTKSYYKVYLSGLIIGGTIIVILTTRNILVLGALLEKYYFPSHVAVSMIRIGDFVERVEVTVAVVFVYGVFIKTSVCLYVACRGISKLLKLRDYRPLVIQTGILMTFLAYILYDTIMEMQFWAFKVYAYYAFPFQVIIPILLWITSEIKTRTSS
jgi:spore germination protein KB